MMVENHILALLKNEKNQLTTYQISKKIGISWSTACMNLYKLKSEGKINGKYKYYKNSHKLKQIWWVD